MPEPRTLRLESVEGSPVNEYRIRGERVEFRALDAMGNPYGLGSEWRDLTTDELVMHFSLDTLVARWLFRCWKRTSFATNVG
jgi:hypothetical protein